MPKATDLLRICLAIGTLEIGGAETQVVGTARALKAAGHDVEVLVLSQRGPLAPLLDRSSIPIVTLGYAGLIRDDRGRLRPWQSVRSVARLLRALSYFRRRRVQVLHAYLFGTYAILVPLARLVGVPVRIAARRGLHTGLPASPLVHPLTRLSTLTSTGVVANASVVAEDAHFHEGVPRNKLHVIPNAVELPPDVADPAKSPAVGLMIANLIAYKGHLDLVRAMSRLDQPPIVRCVGEGPMRLDIERAIRDAGLGGFLRLEGRRAAARGLYADVQFAVLASHEEGMPNAVLEAMAAGLPVVATDVGGVGELIVDGVTGILVPARDPERMAEALNRIANDPEFRRDAGAAGRARAACFGWDSLRRRHEELYLRMLRGAAGDDG